jgi:hypothetical protein
MSSSSQEAGGGGKGLSPVQIFALAYLYHEESKQREKEEMFDTMRDRTHHSQSGVLPRPVSVMVRDLCNTIPYPINPETLTDVEVHNQMQSPVERELLEQEHRTHTGEYAAFSITANGMLVINRVLGRLSQDIQDKKITKKDIDRVEGDSRAKKYLKDLWHKLVDKSQNEIVEMLFSAIRTQGVPLVLLLIELAK